MLRASGTIHVPEGFAGKVFDSAIIGRGFEADGHDGVVGLYKDRGLGGVWQEGRARPQIWAFLRMKWVFSGIRLRNCGFLRTRRLTGWRRILSVMIVSERRRVL